MILFSGEGHDAGIISRRHPQLKTKVSNGASFISRHFGRTPFLPPNAVEYEIAGINVPIEAVHHDLPVTKSNAFMVTKMLCGAPSNSSERWPLQNTQTSNPWMVSLSADQIAEFFLVLRRIHAGMMNNFVVSLPKIVEAGLTSCYR